MRCECHSHNGFRINPGEASPGFAQRELGLDEGVDVVVTLGYLDKVGSVSGSHLIETHWDDATIEEQYRRFYQEVL